MIAIPLGEALEKLLWITIFVAALGVTWLVLTVRYVVQDTRLAREKRLRGSALRVCLYWFYWVAGLVYTPALVGIPFVVASVGMRGLRKWGWVLAAVSHAILFIWLLWLMVSKPLPETATHWTWVGNTAILVVHLAGIWACATHLRMYSRWITRFDPAQSALR